MPKLRIGLLLFPRMTQLDLTGPFEVFTRLPDAQVLLLWKTLEPVEADFGLRLLPYATLRDCPPLDVVCVPGGPGVNALMEDRKSSTGCDSKRSTRATSARSAPALWYSAPPACCVASAQRRIGAPATCSPHSVRRRPMAAWCVTATCSPAAVLLPASISR